MSKYRHKLPQLSGDLFLMDAGVETDLIFNHGIEIREFATHTLLPDPNGRKALADYYRSFLSLANRYNAGFLLGSPTWKAHMHWAANLGASEQELHDANRDAVTFIGKLRDEFADNSQPIVLSASIGPRGDAYAPNARVAADEAQRYHSKQINWLADTEIDMLTALTLTQTEEAIGLVRAAEAAELPIVISFTVETNGRLPSGQPLGEAVAAVDDATHANAAYFMVNCAHPDHFFDAFDGAQWTHRVRGLRCNASRLSHAELDQCEVLDDGNPKELASQYSELIKRMPWLNIFGGCCGTDIRHVKEIVKMARS